MWGNFPDKRFLGIEILSDCVKKANEQYATDRLSFQQGNAVLYDANLDKSADILLFRLTLQHLSDPVKALQNGASYLVPNGYVVVLDTFDKAHKSSPPISTQYAALEQIAEVQKNRGKGNRKVSFELMQAIYGGTSELSDLYEIAFSSINPQGSVVNDTIRFEGEENRFRYFNYVLLLLTLFQRVYQIPVHLEKAYDEVQAYIADENAYAYPGIHFLVLKKKQEGI